MSAWDWIFNHVRAVTTTTTTTVTTATMTAGVACERSNNLMPRLPYVVLCLAVQLFKTEVAIAKEAAGLLGIQIERLRRQFR